MPVSEAPYKRTYQHTKQRGREVRVHCDYCHKLVPKYKTIVVYRSFGLNDPTLKKQIDPKYMHTFKKKLRVCLECSRFRGYVKPGISVRKKHRE